jgi:hypothetical protein
MHTHTTLCQQVKEAGGTWKPNTQAWELRSDHALALGLKARIVGALCSHP